MAKKAIETKEFKFTLDKVNDDEGTFTGYASVWDVVDSYGDAVQKGAFHKTLKEKRSFPLLWSHSVMEPIGTVTGSEDEHGLAVEGVLNLDVQRAREVRSLIKQGAINGLSIGYQTKREEIDKTNGTRKLKEIALWEISPCVFPALDATEITDVKSVDAQPISPEPESAPEQSTQTGPTGTPEQRLHLLDGLKLKF